MKRKPKPQSLANLKSFRDMDPERRKEIQAMGVKKAAEVNRYNKTFKQAVEWALSLNAFRGNPNVDMIVERYPALNNRDAMAIAATAKAVQTGDIKAFIALRDTTGELPEQTVNVKNDNMTINIKLLDDEED